MARMKKNLILLLGVVIPLLLVVGNTTYNNPSVTVAFGGDTLFGGYYHSSDPQFGTRDDLAQMIDRSIQSHGEEEGIKGFVGYAFQNIKPIFAKSAYAVVNLEGPIIATPDTFVPKVFPLRQHVRTPEILKQAGIALVSLANNHMYDFNGATGVEETMQRLEDAGIVYVGAGKGEDAYAEAFGYKVKETNNVKIAFFGVTDVIEPGDMVAEVGKTGVAALPEQANYRESPNLRYLLNRIGEAKKEADFCVVLLHAGPPRGRELNTRQQEIVEILLEAGVDVIIGTHCHSQQPIKEITDAQGRVRQVVFYGIGNLVFGGCKGRQGLSLIALVTFHKEAGVPYLSYEGVPIRPNEDGTFQPSLEK
ncbi:MAG: CapA family protein [Desulfobacterales bacterium]|nr:CapA family protein [Desulfobacterales bacterium]